MALRIKDLIRQLNQQIIHTFLSENLPVMPIEIMHFYELAEKDIKKNSLNTFIPDLLSKRIVPVFFGDMIPLPDGNFKVLSSDEITLFLSIMIKPASVLFLTNVDGVYIQTIKNAVNSKSLTEVLDVSNYHQMWKENNEQLDVSGGMRKKAETALRISKCCKRCCIGNGYKDNILSGFLKGEEVRGTYVVNR